MGIIKRLELPSWVKWDNEWEDSSMLGKGKYQEIKPIIGKDGCYLDRQLNFCWMEYNGKAYNSDLDMFLYELKIEDWEILSSKEVKAIETLLGITRDRLLVKKLQIKLNQHKEKKDLFDIKRGVA